MPSWAKRDSRPYRRPRPGLLSRFHWRPSAPVVRPVAPEPAGSNACEPERIDINTASADVLNQLGDGIGKPIIAGRPYRSVDELVSKPVLKRSIFNQIKDRRHCSPAGGAYAFGSIACYITHPQAEGPAAREVNPWRGHVLWLCNVFGTPARRSWLRVGGNLAPGPSRGIIVPRGARSPGSAQFSARVIPHSVAVPRR
jgi:hypothetical protein